MASLVEMALMAVLACGVAWMKNVTLKIDLAFVEALN